MGLSESPPSLESVYVKRCVFRVSLVLRVIQEVCELQTRKGVTNVMGIAVICKKRCTKTRLVRGRDDVWVDESRVRRSRVMMPCCCCCYCFHLERTHTIAKEPLLFPEPLRPHDHRHCSRSLYSFDLQLPFLSIAGPVTASRQGQQPEETRSLASPKDAAVLWDGKALASTL